MKKFQQNIKENFKYYWSVYKTDQIQRLYFNKKYDRIVTKLKTFEKYEQIKINDYNFLFFLISE